MAFPALVPQVQMLAALLDAEQLKPGSTVGHELHPFDKTGSNSLRSAAGDLRRQRQKEFVHNFRRQKLSEECRSAFVEEPSDPKLRSEQPQYVERSDGSTSLLQGMYLERGQSRCACPRECIPPGRGCDHCCAHSWGSENC